MQLSAGQDWSSDPSLECQCCKDTGHEKDKCTHLAGKLAWDMNQALEKSFQYSLLENDKCP